MSADPQSLIDSARLALSGGRNAEAERQCRLALGHGPSAEAQTILGIALYRSGRLEEARASLQGGTTEALLWLSRVLRRLDRREEALESVMKYLALEPGDSSAHHHAGVCLLELDRPHEAAEAFRRAIALDADAVTLHHGLGLALLRVGDSDGAIEALRRALELEPGSARIAAALQAAVVQRSSILDAASRSPQTGEGWERLGYAYADELRFEDTIHALEKAMKLGRGGSELLQNLAEAYVKVEDYRKAADTFRKALAHGEQGEYLRRRLIEALFDIPDIPAAMEEAEKFVREAPASFEAQTAWCQCRLLTGQTDLANEAIEAAIAIGTQDGPQAFRLATLLRSLGRIPEAQSFLERSIELQPAQGPAYALMAYMRKSTESDLDRIQRMEALAEDEALPLSHRNLLYYGLGKAREDLKQYESAIRAYDEGNRLAYAFKFGSDSYDPRLFVDFHDRAPGVFGPWLEVDLTGCDSNAPILVFGTMRSGTTLMDQILSCHPDVGSVGENVFWATRASAYVGPQAQPLTRVDIERMGKEYLAEMRPLVGGVPRFVDKMPANYGCAPLIHVAMPRAKLIHMKRNPADACLSIYTTINHARIPWAHDKGHIAMAYREYQRLMLAWRAMIPPESMIEIQYEELITNTESVLRGLLEWLGLEWNEACLHPELNQRSVLTPSAWQVRQPINSGSIGRWRRFAPWITEFTEL